MTPEQRLLQQLRDALADADVDVDPLIEEAFAAARAEVSQTLQRLISQDLLRRTLASMGHEPMGHEPSSSASTGTVPPPTPTPPPDPEPAPAPDPDPGPAPDPEPRPAPDPEPAPASGPDPVRGSTAGGQPPEDTTRPTYVYGVTAGVDVTVADLAQLPGGGPARIVSTEAAQAVVCDVDPATFEVLRQPGPEGLDLLAAAAHAHDANLATLAARTTVLPLPLGTVLPDDATVVALLDAYGDRLRHELDRFEGRAEWAVRVHLLDDPSAGDDAARAAASGSEYLRRRGVALEEKQSRWRIREELATRMHERLAACADQADVVVARPLEKDVEPPLLHGVYLLDQTALRDLERVVDELRAEHDAAVVEMTGPWPPYHFASVDLSSSTEPHP